MALVLSASVFSDLNEFSRMIIVRLLSSSLDMSYVYCKWVLRVDSIFDMSSLLRDEDISILDQTHLRQSAQEA